MAAPPAPSDSNGAPAGATTPRRPRALRITGLVVLGLVLLAGLAAILLDTAMGRRLVADQVTRLAFENGLGVRVERIEGSIYGRTKLRGVSVRDPQGEFLYAPLIELDWRPLAYFRNHIDIRSLTIPTAVLRRRPALRTVERQGPLLPDLDIDLDRLRVDRLVAEAPVSGARQTGSLNGEVHIADQRAQVKLAATLSGPGQSVDRLAVTLDARPQAGRLALDARIDAPAGGVMAALAGLDRALTLRLGGRGTWQSWNGQLSANLGKGELAKLALTARNGTFGIKGTARADALLADAVPPLLAAPIQVDLTATPEQRRAAIEGTAANGAFALAAQGTVDLSDNSYDQFALALVVPRPAELAEGLTGSALRGEVVLDGSFAAPRARYALNAARLDVQGVTLERLRASGSARVDADRVVIPVEARAERILGLDSLAGGPLDNVFLAGNLALDGARVLSDDMQIRSSRIDGKAILIADLSRGFYAGTINGRTGDYRIAGVGIFDVTADARLRQEGAGVAMQGRIRARSVRLASDALREQLGGNFAASGDVRYGPDGVVRFSALRLNAPLLRVTGGSGSFVPGGAIRLDAQGLSQQYGRLGLHLTGTVANPRAQVSAERPGLGIGLADLRADIASIAGGYRLAATGQTDYGPLSADVSLLGANTAVVRIDRASLAGIAFAGALRRSAAGPFAGGLTAQGNGLTGSVVISPQGRYQAARFSLRARDTVLPGPAQLAIGNAIVDGQVVLFEQPHVIADIQLAATQLRSYRINAGRAVIDYRGGQGHARVLADGTAGRPFRIAANAALMPALWRVAMDGQYAGLPFKTQSPARIEPRGGSYTLLPTQIAFGRGGVRLAGRYGDGLSVQARLDGVDLAVLDTLVPGAGYGGRASGSLDFSQASPDAFPAADARLTVAGFTRAGRTGTNVPVDVQFVGNLVPDGGEARAVFRQRGSVVGRMTAALRPLGPGAGSWVTRLMAAPLAGGLRYNGPAETLLSLAPQPDHSLSGPIGVAADFSCRVSAPCLSGVIRGNNLVYENAVYGTRLTGLAVNGRFSGSQLEVASLTARAGPGTVVARGRIGLAGAEGYPMDLAIALDNARLAGSDDLSGRATGQLRLTKAAGANALLAGTLLLPETRYRIVRDGAAEIPVLTGVRFKPRRGWPPDPDGSGASRPAALFPPVRLNLRLQAPERLYVTGMGLESEWTADLRVGGTNVAPAVDGELRLIRGTLGFAGRSFELARGQVSWAGGALTNPLLAISASEEVDDIVVNVNVGGRALNPQIAFSSTPGLPQDEIISRILFGRSIAGISSLQAIQLAASLNTLRGGSGGLNPIGKLRSVTGLDRLRIIGPDDATGRRTALAAGKYITDDIYIELITDAQGFTATQLEISLTSWLSVLSQAGKSGVGTLELRVRKDY